jgi:hypothetical protein
MARQLTAAELKHRTTVIVVEGCVKVFTALIMWGFLFGIAYWADDAIKSLSGKTTLAEISAKFLGSFNLSEKIAYGVGAGGMGWGYLERRMRRKKIVELDGRIIDLEKGFDKKRSSSMITTKGTTKKGD